MTNTELQRIANGSPGCSRNIHAVKDGHPGPCMSIAEIIAYCILKK